MTVPDTRDSKLDRWVQRVSLAAMVAVALSLLGAGVALYSPRVEAAQDKETHGNGASLPE